MARSFHESPAKEIETQTASRNFSGMSGLQLKLAELETRKEGLVACQLRIEEDIIAVKRTMELVATV